jgi:hypothetical protein
MVILQQLAEIQSLLEDIDLSSKSTFDLENSDRQSRNEMRDLLEQLQTSYMRASTHIESMCDDIMNNEEAVE